MDNNGQHVAESTPVADSDDPRIVGPLRKPRDRLAAFRELVFDAGARYRDCRLGNFEVSNTEQFYAVERCKTYIDDIHDRITHGEGLLLIGRVGTGKDHLAFAVARGAIVRGFSARWVDGQRWFARMRDRIQEGRSESEAISELLQPELLVLSDPLPPVGELSQYEAGNLLKIIHRRYVEQRPTIVTVNLATAEAGKELIGAQAWDRLIDGAELIWCRWSSYRQPRVIPQPRPP